MNIGTFCEFRNDFGHKCNVLNTGNVLESAKVVQRISKTVDNKVL